MDRALAAYIVRYYSRLMTREEQRADRHLFGTEKATHGRSDAEAQAQAVKAKPQHATLFSSDPAVLELAKDGYEAFVERTATRILAGHAEIIFINKCPRCGRLAKTPKARQCRYCRHDWHDQPIPNINSRLG